MTHIEPVYEKYTLTTVIDCFRWRNTVGLDVALEAARSYLKQRGASPSRLMGREALQRGKTRHPLHEGDGSMSATPVKNIEASVKNRLLAAARQSGKPFETCLTQYSR